jgi:hypothetical protein
MRTTTLTRTTKQKKKTSTKRRKKHSGNMDIALSYRIDKLPRPLKKRVFLNRLISFIDRGDELPRGWLITLRWRNSKKSKWREDEFENAISESREGFVKLVRRRLVRDRSEL